MTTKTNQDWATLLDLYIRHKCPSYWVRWNPDVLLWPDTPKGAFEVGIKKSVHYRRSTPAGVLELVSKTATLADVESFTEMEGDRP